MSKVLVVLVNDDVEKIYSITGKYDIRDLAHLRRMVNGKLRDIREEDKGIKLPNVRMIVQEINSDISFDESVEDRSTELSEDIIGDLNFDY